MKEVIYEILLKEKVSNCMDELIMLSNDVPHENWEKDQYMKDLPGKWNLSIAAVSGNRISGYIIASLKEPQKVHIHKFIVNKAERGKGIGGKLLEEFIKRLDEKIRYVTLKVYRDNHEAVRFYEKNRFKISGYQAALLLMELKI